MALENLTGMTHQTWKLLWSTRRPNNPPGAFTLLELLVTITLVGVLSALLFPALARAREKAKVVKVHTELYNVGLALHMYADDHEGRVPPVRVNCNSDTRDHWCPLPIELAQAGYLARGRAIGRETMSNGLSA